MPSLRSKVQEGITLAESYGWSDGAYIHTLLHVLPSLMAAYAVEYMFIKAITILTVFMHPIFY